MREGLLPEMAAEFNAGDHKTASGHPIEVTVIECDSVQQRDDLVSRSKRAGPAKNGCRDEAGVADPSPTIVTPQAADWLVDVNHEVESEVVDVEAALPIAKTWLGIVTRREMATCLGWPDVELGYNDLFDLLRDGWSKYGSCVRTEWGPQALVAFTNPRTSTSGRNVLVSLYSTAAGKRPAELTLSDVTNPDVVQSVTEFQGLLDHYLPTTTQLNTKIARGTSYGHFFLMPEDNLVSLYKGKEKRIADDGTTQAADPVTDLVMIYPKEGSVLNSHPAGVVQAAWVSNEEIDAAHRWIRYLRDDEQQRTFMDAGFRPATALPIDTQKFEGWGLDTQLPTTVIDPSELQPEVLHRIIGSWGAVKKPAIVTFAVDVSESMKGEKLEQVQTGLSRLLDALSASANQGALDQVGLVTFSDEVHDQLLPRPLEESRYDISRAISEMKAGGQTALFDGVKRAIDLTIAAPPSQSATRAVVVLSDGNANKGTCLAAIVSMISADEVPISKFCGEQGEGPRDDEGQPLAFEEVHGDALLIPGADDVQVFYLGFGDANGHIGRILADATGAEYQGQTDEDLTTLVERLSGYF
jgi:hypothetical protein